MLLERCICSVLTPEHNERGDLSPLDLLDSGDREVLRETRPGEREAPREREQCEFRRDECADEAEEIRSHSAEGREAEDK